MYKCHRDVNKAQIPNRHTSQSTLLPSGASQESMGVYTSKRGNDSKLDLHMAVCRGENGIKSILDYDKHELSEKGRED